MVPLEEAVVHRLDTWDDAQAFRDWWPKQDLAAFDTETGHPDGEALKWFLPGFEMRLFQVGSVDEAFVLRADRFGALIEEFLTGFQGTFVSHNGISFDSHVLRVCGFSQPPEHRWHDTLMASKILDSSGSHGLKDLGAKYFGRIASDPQKALDRAFELHGYAKNQKGLGFSKVPFGTPAFDCYSGVDTILTARLWCEYEPRLEPYRAAYESEMAAWHIVAEIESRGLRVDVEAANELAEEYAGRIAEHRVQLAELGIDKPNTKKQKLEVLIREGFKTDDFTPSGEMKLDKAALEKFASPTARLLIEYSRLEHWRTSYALKMANATNGRVYPSINAFGAITGRQSASNPPVQQLPGRDPEAPKVRRIVLPEDGMDLWSIDYDGEENRLLAHFSNDAALIKLIMSGEDIHRYTAAVVYGIPQDEVTRDQRTAVKNAVYALQYGVGTGKLSRMLAMTKAEVDAIKRGFYAAYPGVEDWNNRIAREGLNRWKAEGIAYAYTWAGRRIIVEPFEDHKPPVYKLTNYVLQGSGADVLKTALNRIAEAGYARFITLPVHDEILFSLPKGDEGAEMAQELARIMAFPDEFRVPLTCSPEFLGERWQPHA